MAGPRFAFGEICIRKPIPSLLGARYKPVRPNRAGYKTQELLFVGDWSTNDLTMNHDWSLLCSSYLYHLLLRLPNQKVEEHSEVLTKMCFFLQLLLAVLEVWKEKCNQMCQEIAFFFFSVNILCTFGCVSSCIFLMQMNTDMQSTSTAENLGKLPKDKQKFHRKKVHSPASKKSKSEKSEKLGTLSQLLRLCILKRVPQ